MNCTVYRVVNGFYAGDHVLDKGDLNPRAPGSWLIPAGCVTVAPPDLRDGEQARWDGSAWVVEVVPEDAPEVELSPENPPPSAAMVQAEARRRLVATDWYVVRQIETGESVPAPVASFRAAIRARCNTLEAMQPIPADYTADQHWPGSPGGIGKTATGQDMQSVDDDERF